jgi:hypothetical protein
MRLRIARIFHAAALALDIGSEMQERTATSIHDSTKVALTQGAPFPPQCPTPKPGPPIPSRRLFLLWFAMVRKARCPVDIEVASDRAVRVRSYALQARQVSGPGDSKIQESVRGGDRRRFKRAACSAANSLVDDAGHIGMRTHLRAMQERYCFTLKLEVGFSPSEQTHPRRLVPFKRCLCS